MRRIVIVLVIIFFFIGCKSSFKSNFRDFNAYYNTFFNAKKSYNLGEEKSENQARKYNTLLPIRIHETPLGAGSGDFQNAIDKGADILRKYDKTKWVDNSLEIIGKSYFYRQEYFSADQKFDELYLSTDDNNLKQRAVFWKGRVLLELQAYNQAIQYLSDQLTLFDGEWEDDLDFQVKAVLAQNYVERENWVIALDLLNESVKKLSRKAYRERGYFLIGQLNEVLGNNEAAFDAYGEVTKHYTIYELQFESQKKRAEVARILGKSDDAYKVFSSMVRDDKNTEFVAELNFELGKTEQERGNPEKAKKIYIDILRDRRSKPDAVTKAKVYNGLAEISRFNDNNYTFAAAYYDSASKANAPEKELPEDFKAKEFAQSFGEYASIKNEIYEQDSLLWLGMLPQEEFDSVLVELERKKREEIARLQKEQEEQRNTLVNVNPNSRGVQEANIERNGFLNYKNPVLIAEVSQQFSAIWGGRPLADNWRVLALIEEVEPQNIDENNNSGTGVTNSGEVFVSIDLSKIPFTEQDQDSVREDLSYLNYELGNLFFLSLNLPDSAEYYFRKVLEERPESNVAPVSLYSISELSFIAGNQANAKREATELVNRFPNSIYADRVIEKYDLERSQSITTELVSEKDEYLAISNDQMGNDSLKTKELFKFYQLNRKSVFGEKALVDVVDLNIKRAVQDSSYKEAIKSWNLINESWVSDQERFKIEKDSARISIQDSSLSSIDSLYYNSLIDSLLTPPNFEEFFPYKGAYWDSTRSKIEIFIQEYPVSSSRKRMLTLQKEFKVIEGDKVQDVQDEKPDDLLTKEGYLSCTEIEEEVFVRGGMNQFLRTIDFSFEFEDDEITFLFFINNRGIIDEFKLSSATENEELINAFISAIDKELLFEPVLYEGVATPVSCEVVFELGD